MSHEKSKYQEQFDALPEWAQKMVRAAAHIHSTAFGRSDYPKLNEVRVGFDDTQEGREAERLWTDGLWELEDLGRALTAPYPPPAAPVREKRAFNIVEFIAGDDDDEGGGFDQPCCFGNRVGHHAVYCHNEGWPNSPRKCRRNLTDFRHEDCPGFVANPDYTDDLDAAKGGK